MGKFYSKWFEHVESGTIKSIFDKCYPFENKSYESIVRMLNNASIGRLAKIDVVDKTQAISNKCEYEPYEIIETYFLGPFGLVDMHIADGKEAEYIVEHRDLNPWLFDITKELIKTFEGIRENGVTYQTDDIHNGIEIVRDWMEGKTQEEVNAKIREGEEIIAKRAQMEGSTQD